MTILLTGLNGRLEGHYNSRMLGDAIKFPVMTRRGHGHLLFSSSGRKYCKKCHRSHYVFSLSDVVG